MLRMQKLVIAKIREKMASCLSLSEGEFSSTSSGDSTLAKRDLYQPRCLPDGDVVVVSFQDRILSLNSSVESSAGMESSVALLMHAWSKSLQFGVSLYF